MNKLKKIGLILGLSALCAVPYFYNQNSRLVSEEIKNCNKNIHLKHSKKEIEDIVNDIDSPGEAFFRINKDILFEEGHDPKVLHCKDRWTSMQETYALGSGDCEDGSIMFKGMLINHPEFEVEIIWLIPKLNPNKKIKAHVINTYKENGKYGYVSFNERNSNRFHAAIFEDKDSAIRAFNKYFNKVYEKYTEMEFTNEELKFGKNLNKHRGRSPDWTNLE